jgi:catechol 2,3-dioxygenase-like lactoylglutathione lyase family enzyme
MHETHHGPAPTSPKPEAMFDHVEIPTADIALAKAFYRYVLAELGYDEITDHGAWCGFGRDGSVPFAVFSAESVARNHLAFAASDRAAVDRFYRAALSAGGRDNGAPGLRPDYSPTYYAAFVLDPDGNNVEAVCKTG